MTTTEILAAIFVASQCVFVSTYVRFLREYKRYNDANLAFGTARHALDKQLLERGEFALAADPDVFRNLGLTDAVRARKSMELEMAVGELQDRVEMLKSRSSGG